MRQKTFDDVSYLCVKFKNLKTADIREVREEINQLLTDFWAEPEYLAEEKHSEVRFDDK